MQVRIVELDGDLDPDEYCKERGADAYRARLDSAKGYFHWLADRARAKHDLRTTRGPRRRAQFSAARRAAYSRPAGAYAGGDEVAGYIGVDQANQGTVLDAFMKSVTDRNERPMQKPAGSSAPMRRGC